MKSAVAILSQKEQGDEYFSRLRLGLDVFSKNNLDYVVLLSESCNEKNIDFILEKGIPREKIILEPRPKDTIGEAYFLKHSVLLPNDIKSIHVVTSDYHMVYRARIIFDYMLADDYSVNYHKSKTGKVRHRKFIVDQLRSLNYFSSLVSKYPDDNLIIVNHPLYEASSLERKK